MQGNASNITGKYIVLCNARGLKSGTLNPEVLNVWKDVDGKIWILDYRRLAAFRLSGLEEAPIHWADATKHIWKMKRRYIRIFFSNDSN